MPDFVWWALAFIGVLIFASWVFKRLRPHLPTVAIALAAVYVITNHGDQIQQFVSP